MRYFIIVGEASADLHASRLVEAIKLRDAEASFAFMGGDLLAEVTGEKPIVHYRDVAFMGLIPVLMNYSKIKSAANRVQRAMLDFKPDVVIPVDYAGFNLRYILPFVKKHLSAKLIYYIPPKLWAWKAGRIKTLRKYVDLLLCILPFEEQYFSERGVNSCYVGNPCVDATLDYYIQGEGARKEQIAILPGSRKQELKSNLALMLESVRPYTDKYHIVVAGAPGLNKEDYQPYMSDYEHVEVVFGNTYNLVSTSKLALVTSGTATLETALLGTPEIVFYRMGGQRIARWVFETFFSVPFISLVNLILGRALVPELIGSEVNVSRIRQEIDTLLDTSNYAKQIEGIGELRNTLGQERTGKLASEAILDYVKSNIS